MSIPEYILKAADEYCKSLTGVKKELAYNAFIAGHKATRQPKSKSVEMSEWQEQLFEDCWEAYKNKGNKAKAKVEFSKLSESETKQILPHLKVYVANRDRCYLKDFERYLRDKVFTTVIVKGNDTIYNPEQFANIEEYRPTTDGIFQYWNPDRKCLMFNGYIDQLNDGYTKDNRPDGAKVVWSMYEWIWSSRTKEWIKQND